MAFAALDTSQNSRNLIACMRERGITAIGRYYTKRRTNSKILTADEARRLSDAGIRTWVVYQNRHREPVDFSPVKGKLEAEDALDYAKNVINQPAGSGIYFSADFDASQATFNSAIRPHFEAIAAAFAAAGNPYRIGVYSSGAVCKGLLDAGLVELTWLSQSGGFRGTPEFKASRRWNILQALPVKHFCDFDNDVDPDEINASSGDFGGFLLQAAQPMGLAAARLEGVAAATRISNITVPPSAEFPGTLAFRGRPIHRGETGSDDVKALQSRLNDLKFGPLVVDGDFGEATENAVMHFQARNSTTDGQPLSIDGEVGANTWAALFGPGAVFSTQAFDSSAPMRQLVIDIAASQIGVVEQPRGSNRGPEVDVYIRTTGLDPAADSFPWCVCFLYWVFDQAAKIKRKENPLPKTAGVISLWNLGRRTEAEVVRRSEANAQTVKPGMIFHLNLGGGKGHAGLVTEVHGDQIITIEGNTNPGGSSEGYGVFRRDARSITSNVLLGYLDFCDV
jgi:glycoside hydrolase-like protein/putative peptidoglycan binding protein/CHAP domain-containing protein